ncbi:hypothetical protein ACJMK2_037971, partial [Sinanodonta woodiana]
ASARIDDSLVVRRFASPATLWLDDLLRTVDTMNKSILFLSDLAELKDGIFEDFQYWLNLSDFNFTEFNSSLRNHASIKNLGHMCSKRFSYHKDYTQIDWVLSLVIIIYILVLILAILGNLLVIWTIWRNSHMHTVTNYYIVNLALSDLLVSTIVIPLKLLEYTADCTWQIFKADELCGFLSYLLPIFVFASVLTLVAISLE